MIIFATSYRLLAKRICILTLITGLGGSAVFANSILIDNFSVPATAREISSGAGGAQQQWTDPEGGGTYTDGDGVIGGVRDGSLGCEDYDNVSNVQGDIGSGLLNVRASGNSTTSIYLSYDGTPGWPANGPQTERFNGVFATPIDVSTYTEIVFGFTLVDSFEFGEPLGGFNDFKVTFLQGAPAGEYNNPIYWYTYDAATSGLLGGANDLVNSVNAQTFAISMTDLKNNDGTGTNAIFDAVQAIQIHICTEDKKSEYTLDYIGVGTPVPEPQTLAMVLLAAAGALGLRRTPVRP